MAFYCNGKKGICDKISSSKEYCPAECEFTDGTGGFDCDAAMTNFDYIRSLNVVKLAEFLAERMAAQSFLRAANKGHEVTATQRAALEYNLRCTWLGWLQMPWEEEGNKNEL